MSEVNRKENCKRESFAIALHSRTSSCTSNYIFRLNCRISFNIHNLWMVYCDVVRIYKVIMPPFHNFITNIAFREPKY